MSYLVWNKYSFFLVIAGIFMLLLSLLDVPTLSDDMVYRFVWQEHEDDIPRQIQNIGDLIHSQWVHYQLINGRWVVHTLAQAFFAFTPLVCYQVANAVLFVVLLYFSTSLFAEKERRLFAAIMMCFFLFVVFQGVRTALLWSMGTFNYLWTTVMTLGFLYCLRRMSTTMKPVHLLLVPCSVIVGCSHEAISLPLSITFLVYIFVHRKTIFRQPIVLCLIGYIIGTTICLLSPGIWNRAGEGISIFNRLLSGAVNLVFNIRVTWLLLLSLFVVWRKDRTLFKQELCQNKYAYLTLVMCVGIVIFCGTNLERVAFFADFVSMLLLVSLLSRHLSGQWCRRIAACCATVLLVFCVFAVVVRAENYRNYLFMVRQMEEPGKELIAVRQPVRGQNAVVDFFRKRFSFPPAEFSSFCCYMGFNEKDINIREAAMLYGKQKMVFLPEDVINRIESDTAAYSHYELDANKDLYIWHLDNDRPVNKVVFHLKPEDPSKLLPHQRLVAYKDDTYELDDDFHYAVVTIHHRPYLIFTRPTTNVYRRIDHIDLF